MSSSLITEEEREAIRANTIRKEEAIRTTKVLSKQEE